MLATWPDIYPELRQPQFRQSRRPRGPLYLRLLQAPANHAPAAAIAEIAGLRPNVVLMSVDLPDASGYEACRQIIDQAPCTRVIMLISEPAEEVIAGAMMAGAAGCLPTNSPQFEVILIVRYNGKGAMYQPPEVAKVAIRTARNNSNFINMIRLSSRERKIIVMAADGLSYREIGEKLGISQHTVRNQTGRMLTKLNVTRRAELSNYAPLIRVLNVDGIEAD